MLVFVWVMKSNIFYYKKIKKKNSLDWPILIDDEDFNPV